MLASWSSPDALDDVTGAVVGRVDDDAAAGGFVDEDEQAATVNTAAARVAIITPRLDLKVGPPVTRRPADRPLSLAHPVQTR